MTSASFPRAARLLASDDFVRALKTRAQRGRYLWIYRNSPAALAPAMPARPQLGLMIGKRNARSAVLRNAIKRRLREQFRLRQQGLPSTQYVVRLSATVKKADVPQVIDEWRQSLERDCRKRIQAEGSSP